MLSKNHINHDIYYVLLVHVFQGAYMLCILCPYKLLLNGLEQMWTSKLMNIMLGFAEGNKMAGWLILFQSRWKWLY